MEETQGGGAASESARAPTALGAERTLDADSLAWTALVAHWTGVAQAACVLPRDAEGDRWRAAVPHVIELQALAFALHDVQRVAAEERAFARDRAAVRIRAAAGALDALWRGEPMPDALLALMADAQRALRAAAHPGLVELVWRGPGAFVVPAADESGGPETPGGTLLMMAPGTIALPGDPVAIVAERPLPRFAGVERIDPCEVPEMRQLYRTFDATGRWSGSFRQALDDELPAGMPMLVPLWVQGERVGHFTLNAAEWTALQRAAGIGSAPTGGSAECDRTNGEP